MYEKQGRVRPGKVRKGKVMEDELVKIFNER